MLRLTVIAALLALPVTAVAQVSPADRQAETGKPPERVRSVTLTAGQKCPASTSDEVVVCQTLDEPYRLPKGFRDSPVTAANQSWVNRADALDDIGRTAGGLPDTCSPVGTGGQTGCFQARARAYAADKREAADAARRPAP